MADLKKFATELTIVPIADGGYLVLFSGRDYCPNEFKFACTTMEEALDYVRRNIKPQEHCQHCGVSR